MSTEPLTTSTKVTKEELDHAKPHAVPLYVLLNIFAALMVLSGITVGIAFFDLGQFNIPVAVGIATVKACLVGAYFMHLRYDNPFNALILIGSFCFVGLFIIIALFDSVENHDRFTDADTTNIYEMVEPATEK